MNCSGERVDIQRFTSEVLRLPFLVEDMNGAPIDITDWSAAMMIREDPADTGAAEVSIQTGTPTANDSVITIKSATGGELEIYISNADLVDGLSIPSGERSKAYYYDIVLTNADGDTTVGAYGQFIWVDGITE